jgi:parvulin-like peptidyl-prolyl isomerase
VIEITGAERARLKDQWQAQMGRAPSEQELTGLIDQWIREEIYYREAKRMGLDNNDIIIRRRLAQKLTFLTEDVATSATPSEDELQTFFRENSDRYTVPARVSFRHRYFSTERRSDARADAAAAIAAGAVADESISGDPFMLQLAYAQRSQREIADLFGAEFALALQELPEGGWQGPIASAYGWHAVTIEQRIDSRVPTFEEIARKVSIDHKQELRRLANERYYDGLRSRYEIVGS